jgi:REP element-mobilizing transposase RayT
MAREFFKEYPEIKEELRSGKVWSDLGYFGNVGEWVNAEIIRNYIKKQVKDINQLKLSCF